MSYFTSASVITSILALNLVPSAIAAPTGPDLLVGNYINPSQSTQKVETTMAKIQGLLEIKCSNYKNPKAEAKCDSKKFGNSVLVKVRNSSNLRVTLANLSGVKPAQVNKTQLTELGFYQEVLQFQAGKVGDISPTAQNLLESVDLVSFE